MTEPVAIVGMAARVPGAGDIGQFWTNLIDGVESVTFFDSDEQRARGATEDELADPYFVRAAPVLDQIEYFDAALFGMTAREAELADPQQRIFLELAHSVLADAGCDPVRYPGEIAVYAGSAPDDYKWLNLQRNRRAASAGALSLSVGNNPDYIATTVSYRLNLRGPSLTLHTACSTSLVALHLACEALRGGECDLALAGGVCVELPHGLGYMGVAGYTSSDGHCRPFDAKADGTIWGSGAGLVALKRLPDAIADGDSIRALILGNAVNNDGAAKVGFSAPSVEGQAEVIAQALGVADIDPRSIGYVEAHGTGTALGDPIEIAALTRVYGANTTDTEWCAIGSVKSNVGHLSHAAGVVGVIKAALALDRGVIPPSINFSEPNPAIDFESSPFYVASTLSSFEGGDRPRRAAVSSFGIGGTNAHIVLEQAPVRDGQAKPHQTRPVELLRISARTESALAASAASLADHLAAAPDLHLGSVAHTLHLGRPEYPRRAFALAGDVAEAVTALRDPKKLVTGQADDPPARIAMLFSGQGSQYPGMGQQLHQAEPVFARVFDECCDILADAGGLADLRAIVAGTGQEGVLTDTRYAQPALFALEYALASLWQSWGVVPAAMIGHSIGELVAATVAGVFALPDALRLVALRGRLMSAMPPGAMLAVQLGASEVAERLPAGIGVATVNGPGTCVVAGSIDAIGAFAAELKAAGIRATALRTSHAFHSPMMEPVVTEFAEAVEHVARAQPRVPFGSNVTGDWITGEQATDPGYWAAQLRQPVLFGRCIATLAGAGTGPGAGPGARPPGAPRGYALLECGPGRQLASLARMQLPAGWPRPLPSLPGAGEKAEDLRVIRATAGRLWLAGVPVDDSLEAAPPRRVPLPGYPYERVRCWIDPDDSVEPASAPAARVDDTRPRPVSDWFAVPVWRQAPPVPSAVPAGRFVVFAAERRGDELAAALREAGKAVVIVRPGPQFAVEGDCWQIRPAERDDYDALIEGLANEEGRPDRFVHAWALAGDPAGHDVAAARAAQEHGFFSLLRLGQAIAAGPTAAPAAAPASAPAAPTRLDVLVAGTQDVRGDDLDRPEHATTAGITRVLPLEIPGLTARRIDLDPGGTPVGRLLAELASEPAAETVALRGGRRWVREFADLTLPEPAETEETSPPALREGGRYLITGGLGGLGLTLAADLARRSRARLVLLSRTGQASHPDQQAAIAEMERAGSEVQVIAADVCDPESMARVRDQVIDSLGGLDGIVHAAGVPGGGLAEVKDEAVARAVLEPKLAGSLVLLSTLGEITRDFIALCSSVTAVTGGVGQVDYCGANAFLDALAGSGHALPGKVISLNWGGWSEVGMLAKALETDDLQAQRQLEIDHPLLRTAAIVEPAGPVRAEGTISASTHWVLGEHVIGGQPVLPGTAHLELARAVASLTGPVDGGAIELRDVVFTEPFAVPDVADYSVTLERGKFRVTSGRKSFSQGIVGIIEAGRRPVVDVEAIRARCRPAVDSAWETGRTSAVTFGPRWDCLARVWIGDDEELGLIEAPPPVAAELGQWGLHPALLDVATAFGVSKRDGAYLPLSYGRVVVRGPLPARFYSHLRYEAAGGGVLSAAVTICDEQGNELVAITDFTLRQVDAQAQSVVGGRAAATAAGPARSADGLISPADGALAFRLVLAADLGPQVAVTPARLSQIAARIAREGADLAGDSGGAPAPQPGGEAGPGGSLEDNLIRIWTEVLGVAPSSASDDFFDLGGNSLVAVGLIGTVREAFGVRLPMRILFEAPTVAGLAAQIRRMQAEQGIDDRVGGAAQEEQIPTIPRAANP